MGFWGHQTFNCLVPRRVHVGAYKSKVDGAIHDTSNLARLNNKNESLYVCVLNYTFLQPTSLSEQQLKNTKVASLNLNYQQFQLWRKGY